MNSRYKRNYTNIKRQKREMPIKETIGQCTLCIDTFTIFYNDLEGIFPSASTYIEIDNKLFHKCGGKISLWKM